MRFLSIHNIKIFMSEIFSIYNPLLHHSSVQGKLWYWEKIPSPAYVEFSITKRVLVVEISRQNTGTRHTCISEVTQSLSCTVHWYLISKRGTRWLQKVETEGSTAWGYHIHPGRVMIRWHSPWACLRQTSTIRIALGAVTNGSSGGLLEGGHIRPIFWYP